MAAKKQTKRLIIISNRLPVSAVRTGGALAFEQSAGGLVSGVKAYCALLPRTIHGVTIDEYCWVGWPGIAVAAEEEMDVTHRLQKEFHAYPVFLSERLQEQFYEGACNNMLWPLFHYFPSYVHYDEDYWTYYKKVNETFCDAVARIARPGDIVWVHDYQLMLLPQLLREKIPDISIGFFLHIPFPAFEIFSLLPRKWRRGILDGLLGADFIGFHTHDYTQAFLRCVLRVFGYEHTMGRISVQDRIVKAETMPMGIDFQKFFSAVRLPAVRQEKRRLQRRCAGMKTILSIDRLDYTKGILHRLEAYKIFLERYPEWRRRVVLILTVVPSRNAVGQYAAMKQQIDELAGNINGAFGSVQWTPILYQYRSLSFETLVAHYAASDVALVTPLRDGMNLIAKEYVTTRTQGTGVLIISEFAGAAKELGEALVVNPNHREDMAEAIATALAMTPYEQRERLRTMHERLRRYDIRRWSDDFLQSLFTVRELARQGTQDQSYTQEIWGAMAKQFHYARRRLFVFDYDGTLVPFSAYPHLAQPPKKLLDILRRLAKNRANTVVLMSGRDRATMQQWFAGLPIGLVAEHGMWIKRSGKQWHLLKRMDNEWIEQIAPILAHAADRLPGAFVEKKRFSIAWHYRMADPELGSLRAKELLDDLVHFIANKNLQVLQGKKVLEVRIAGIDKGAAVRHFLGTDAYDCIIAMGDDETDEDMFAALPAHAYSIKVGNASATKAKMHIHDPEATVRLLENFLKK